MSLESIYKFSDKTAPATDDALDQLEAAVGAPLPLGYRDYMTMLGDGVYCDQIHIYTPAQVLKYTPQYKPTLFECFEELAPGARAVLSPADAGRGLAFGDMTPDGPYRAVLWHVPGAPHPLYVLIPFHDQIYWIEQGCHDPLKWVGLSGPCDEVAMPFRYFESNVRRMVLALDHFLPIPVSFVRSRLEELFPGCITKVENPDEHGRLNFWHAWNRPIGGRVIVASHIAPIDGGGAAVRVDTNLSQDIEGLPIAGAGVTIDYDRDMSKTVDDVVSTLCEEGFKVRFKTIR